MPKQPTFEEAMHELEEILQKMGQEETSLDDSIAYYARAAELIRVCNEQLKNAQIRVDEIGKTIASTEEADAE